MKMVSRVQLGLRIVAPPAANVTTAVGFWIPPERRGPERTPQRRDPAQTTCNTRASLKLLVRPAEPHELASTSRSASDCEEDDEKSHQKQSCRDDVRHVWIILMDGRRLRCSAAVLAKHSCMLTTLLASPGWHESASDEITFAAHDPEAVRATIAWMSASRGPGKREAARRLMSADLVVETARLAHYLEIKPLLAAALATLSSALDAANATCVLGLARELGESSLEQQAISFILAQLDAVAEADSFFELPPQARAALRALRTANAENPLLSPGQRPSASCVATDARELCGMVREALFEMQDRLAVAREREAAEVEAVRAERSTARVAEIALPGRSAASELAAAGTRRPSVSSLLEEQATRIRVVYGRYARR